VIRSQLAALSGHAVPVVDSAQATAEELSEILRERGLAAEPSVEPGACSPLRLLVTDLPKRFSDVAARFLGEEPSTFSVEPIDL